jgi:adenosylcobyric acid synthase
MAAQTIMIQGTASNVGKSLIAGGYHAAFSREEREMVKGVLINKFRGDPAILRPGLGQLEAIIHRPVLGVIPYPRLDIDDEDSLSERFYTKQEEALLDIAVIRLPHISNFTDFNALGGISGAGLRYVDHRGTPVIGIRGGYQIPGKSLKDPGAAEFCGEMEGLGLLPVVTVFEREKVRTMRRRIYRAAVLI